MAFNNSLEVTNLLLATNKLQVANSLQVVNSLEPGGVLPVQTTPTFSPVAGAYNGIQTVTITSAGADTIYYTTDGSTPTTGSTVYSTPLVVFATETIKALAVKAGYSNSAIGSATYTINNLSVVAPGYFWGVQGLWDDIGGASIMANPGANKVQVSVFELPFNIIVNEVSFEVTTLKVATHMNIGLYDSSGNKVLDSGQISTASLGIQFATGLATTLTAGTYYLAWSSDDASNTVQCSYFMGNSPELNVNKVRWGTATNNTVAGVMPATLGTILNGSQGQPPCVFFGA